LKPPIARRNDTHIPMERKTGAPVISGSSGRCPWSRKKPWKARKQLNSLEDRSRRRGAELVRQGADGSPRTTARDGETARTHACFWEGRTTV